MELTLCKLGKFLVVPTFVVRWLQVCKDAREPSGKSWNYCREGCNVIFQEWPLLHHVGTRFLQSTMGRQPQLGYLLRICVENVACDIPYNSNDARTSDYLCYISFRNMKCVKWRISLICTLTPSIYGENGRELWANKIIYDVRHEA